MQTVLVLIGLLIAAGALAAILWSIAYPKHRLWPPQRYTGLTPILIWIPTFTLFGILLVLGLMEWGRLAVPNWLRFGVGIPFILVGNVVVWSEVGHFGMAQTAGARGALRTTGMYRYSRNPQYVADIAMVAGLIVLCASASVAIVGSAVISVLIAAPFAEEPWLTEQYGSAFETYKTRVRRFL